MGIISLTPLFLLAITASTTDAVDQNLDNTKAGPVPSGLDASHYDPVESLKHLIQINRPDDKPTSTSLDNLNTKSLLDSPSQGKEQLVLVPEEGAGPSRLIRSRLALRHIQAIRLNLQVCSRLGIKPQAGMLWPVPSVFNQP